MNHTFEWGVLIATILSVRIVPRHCARLTYFLHPKLRKINAVPITPLIALTLWHLRRAGSIPIRWVLMVQKHDCWCPGRFLYPLEQRTQPDQKWPLLMAPTCHVILDGPPTSGVLFQGMLLAGILWPRELRFKFDEHINVVMGLLSIFALAAFSTAIGIKVSQGTTYLPTLFLYACHTCTQIVSPLIPALLVVGQTAASGRLRLRQIFCINPKRITVAGKVRLMCFDKTGTLTKQGLDFSGPLPVADGKLQGHPLPPSELHQVCPLEPPVLRPQPSIAPPPLSQGHARWPGQRHRKGTGQPAPLPRSRRALV